MNVVHLDYPAGLSLMAQAPEMLLPSGMSVVYSSGGWVTA